MSNSDAVKKLKMPRIVVRRTVLRYQRLRLQDEFPKAGHQFTLTPPAVVKAVREIIRQKPEKSTRKMVNDVCIFHRLVETIASEKLYLYYYQMQKTAFLTEKYQLFRKKKAQHLLRGTQAIFKPFLHFFDDEILAVEADENEKQAPSPYLNELDYDIHGYSSLRVFTENYPSFGSLMVAHEKLWDALQPKRLRAVIDSSLEGIEL
ncbi:hypothetical protein B9Z55_013485 [Caenorhabditis nigoni]|uniref:Uncharacterized protein n=1 Tax=Caenorhabditis nigoni TaxID=1611254 RepID=A0A2G5U2E1_9PELO|nr:hypothetical protein B9Z55_013485 [Caenorhabditis nigoni]